MNDPIPKPDESRVSPERTRPITRARAVALGLGYWLALVPLTIAPRHSGNVWSRYMTIESIVERGTLAIDASPLMKISGSPDLVKVDGRTYSDKPPVLSALSAIVYAPMHAIGWSFNPSAGDVPRVNLVLVSLVVGLSSAIALIALRLMFQYVPIPRWTADLATLGCGLGTLLLTYGVTFNNHSVAAGLVTAAFGLVMSGRGRGVLSGVLAGLAATIDLPAGGLTLGALGVWLVLRDRRSPWEYLAASVGPIALHVLLQWSSTGSPLPAEMTPEKFHYEDSYWETEVGRFRETVPRWLWGVELLLGPQGWLTLTPDLVFGLLGIVIIAVKRHDPLRWPAIMVGTMVAVLVAFYTWGVRRTDFAGLSFGTRHLLAVTPLVWYFAVAGLARLRFRLLTFLFLITFPIGLGYAWAGMLDPWSRVERRRDVVLLFLQRGVIYPHTIYRR